MTFGTVGCWPAGPIRPPGPWCLGPARGVPRPAPGRTSWANLGKVRSWFLRCSEGDVWHRGLLARGPDPSSRAMVFGPCEGVPRPAPGRTSWGGLGKVRSWFLRCSEGDVWHRGLLARGPDPSSRAMLFGPCEGVPRPAPGRTSGLVGKVRSWFLRCSEGDVWHRGLLARGPDPSSRAMVWALRRGPSTRAGPHFMGWFREAGF